MIEYRLCRSMQRVQEQRVNDIKVLLNLLQQESGLMVKQWGNVEKSQTSRKTCIQKFKSIQIPHLGLQITELILGLKQLKYGVRKDQFM